VAEDDNDVRGCVVETLAGLGYEVTGTAGAEDASNAPSFRMQGPSSS
jgi:hypothetical protein